jgi:methylated-DNA-protein-cysteine methyltransferase related protein
VTVAGSARGRPEIRDEAEGDFTDAVVAVIAATRPGDVLTYGEVAAEAGFPGAARAVGALLARSPAGLPWWRIVTASGRLAPGAEREHARRLRAEGVAVRDGHVRHALTGRRGG